MKDRLAAWALLLLTTILLQRLGGAYSAGWGGHPDEPAHVMTGLMVRDYLAAKCPWPPMRFAEQYYVHYPKVALGHWPPFFYLALASWMLLTGPARVTLLLFMAVIGASIAAFVYEFLRGEVGRWTALLFALLTTTIPLMQQSVSSVMSDGLVALLCLAAIWFYARYLESERFGSALMFGALAGVALITKGTGVVLAGVPPLAVAASRRWGLLRKLSFWSPAVMVVAVAGPWYAYQFAAFPDTSIAWAGIGKAREGGTVDHIITPFKAVGLPLMCLAAIGLVGRWFRAATPRWAVLGALALASSVMHCWMHAVKEPRHMLMAVPAVLALAAAGSEIVAACRGPFSNLPIAGKRLGVMIVVLLAHFAATFEIPLCPPAAFRDAANLVLSRTQAGTDRVLISSDASGEGDLIVELAIRENRPGHVVLRAFKTLAQAGWNGADYRLLFSAPAEMRAELDRLDVGLLVMDSQQSSEQLPHHAVLKAMIAGSRDAWPLVGSLTCVTQARQVSVYERAGGMRRARSPIEVPVRQTLKRTLRETLGGLPGGVSPGTGK